MPENEFKKIFKYYKRKDPPPSFENVIDPSSPENQSHFKKIKVAEPNEPGCDNIQPRKSWTILESKLNPGLYVILDIFSPADRVYWSQECLNNYSSSSYKRNIDAHTDVKDWREATKTDERICDQLRWSTLGYHHNWDTKEYSEDNRGVFPPNLARVSEYIVGGLGYTRYMAEAAIVNFYPMTGTLSGHTDHSEHNLAAPLLSISLGQDAVFLLGGTSTEHKPVPYLLSSGTVVIMDRESRLCYHGIPRIIKVGEDSCNCEYNDTEDEFMKKYLSTHRININIRQVN